MVLALTVTLIWDKSKVIGLTVNCSIWKLRISINIKSKEIQMFLVDLESCPPKKKNVFVSVSLS